MWLSPSLVPALLAPGLCCRRSGNLPSALHLLEAQPSWGKADSGAVQSWGAGTSQAFLEASATPNWHETLGKVSAPPGLPTCHTSLRGSREDAGRTYVKARKRYILSSLPSL